MKASSGLYVSRLDHVRACAALLVYCWHVVHPGVPYAAVPDVPLLSPFEEGHVGVALFMTLSGYLFAKIIDGHAIDLPRFYLNRVLRLAPLLAVVLGYWALRGALSFESFISGFVQPTWSGGAWSVAVELHFYLLFPLILMLQTRGRLLPLLVILMLAIALRGAVWLETGSVQILAYKTIAGCLDLFVWGMLWHELARHFGSARRARALFWSALAAIVAGCHGFNLAGGYYGMGGDPSPSPLWIVMTSIEGLLFGALIVGYEHARFELPAAVDRVWARVGEVSYSIYLVHFMVFPSLVKWAGLAGLPMDHFPTALAVAFGTFPIVAALSMVSYAWIERPFLALRVNYRRAARDSRSSGRPHATTAAA